MELAPQPMDLGAEEDIGGPKVGNPGKRNLQHVTTLESRVKVLKWMKEEEKVGAKKIPSRAVALFPEHFRSMTANANLQKANRLLKSLPQLPELIEAPKTFSIVVQGGRREGQVKALDGRGRKLEGWVSWLYPLLLEEFHRLKRAGLKFSPGVLKLVALDIVQCSDNILFNARTRVGEVKLLDKITPRRIQLFMEAHNIVGRAQTGKLMVSPEKREAIDRAVVAYLGQMSRRFASGELNEEHVANMDETHFIINVDNGRTLGFKGDEEVKYSDVSSGGEGMTMVLKLTGGVGSMLLPPMIIFTNANYSYPIRGLADNVIGATYRSGPKGFMDRRIFREWLEETACNPRRCEEEVIFLDNYGGHNETPEIGGALQRRGSCCCIGVCDDNVAYLILFRPFIPYAIRSKTRARVPSSQFHGSRPAPGLLHHLQAQGLLDGKMGGQKNGDACGWALCKGVWQACQPRQGVLPEAGR